MYARLRCGGNLPLCVRAFGTRNTLLRYEVQFAPSYGTVCSSFRGALHQKPPSGVWNEAIGCDRCVADPLLPTTFVNCTGKIIQRRLP